MSRTRANVTWCQHNAAGRGCILSGVARSEPTTTHSCNANAASYARAAKAGGLRGRWKAKEIVCAHHPHEQPHFDVQQPPTVLFLRSLDMEACRRSCVRCNSR